MTAIHSMTGFGRCEKITDSYRILTEFKSVNHRYLDLAVKMPRRFNCFEAKIRQLVKQYIERGKTDLYITYEDYTAGSKKLSYNGALAAEYAEYASRMEKELGLENDLTVSKLMRMPEVLAMEETTGNEEAVWEELQTAISEAAEQFCTAREKEGERLKSDLLGKLSNMEELVGRIEAFSPSVVENYRERLGDRIRETLSDSGLTADESRIVTEVTIFADKICTDEEMVRLKSHIAALQKKLEQGGPCGRELDFIAQEMNREANTTLSKANSLEIADTAIALKTEIEKIREQVQNIE